MSTVHENRSSRFAGRMGSCLRRSGWPTWIIAAGVLLNVASAATAQTFTLTCCTPLCGSCEQLSRENCEAQGGFIPFDGSCDSCRAVPNCCMPSGECQRCVPRQECESQGGFSVDDCSVCPMDPNSGACCIPKDGTCVPVIETLESAAFNCSILGGQYKGAGTTCADSDGDGIPDVAENNDCVFGFIDHCNTGSDPNNPDTDGDGLLDGDDSDPCTPAESFCAPESQVGSIVFDRPVTDRFVPTNSQLETDAHFQTREMTLPVSATITFDVQPTFFPMEAFLLDSDCHLLVQSSCLVGATNPCLNAFLESGTYFAVFISTEPNFPEPFTYQAASITVGQDASGACCFPEDGSCEVMVGADENSLGETCTFSGGEFKGLDTDCDTDRDGDGIPDVREVGDCTLGLGDPCNVGSSPDDPDSDGDGVSDGDEVAQGSDPCVHSASVACCLPEGGCRDLLLSECQNREGVRVPSCLGDLTGNGLDDACPVACCLGDGGCEVLPDGECTGSLGMPVEECLDDANDDGRDDACRVACCDAFEVTCSMVPLGECFGASRDQVSECLGDLDGDGRDDACPVSCCLPDGSCIVLPDGECSASGGTAVAVCLGDHDGDGVNDGCPVPCCLPDGSCDLVSQVLCPAIGGTQVDACLGDQDNDGRDDACPVSCCFSDIGLCLSTTADACAEAFGVEVPQCLDDLNGNGTNDACPVACCLSDGACLAMPDGDCSNVGTAVLFCAGDQDNDGRDDACEGEQVSCCLGDGLLCLETTESDCAAEGGMPVPACLGDQNDDGLDDACRSPFDSDADGDVDLGDYLALLPCIGHPGVPAAPGCERFDTDGDGDVDLSDALGFWGAFTGSR